MSALSKSKETIDAEAAAAMQALVEMFSKPKRRRYRRYMLVRSLTGELQFEQESLGAMLDEIFDETIGRSKPRRPRVIRIDQPLNHR